MMSSWRNRFAFYLLAVGSACGLGNLWRFPYIAGENGGGAFILLYLLLSFTVGLSILVSELILGQSSEAGFLKLSHRISTLNKKPLYLIARVTLILTLVILSYYSVVSGWVIHYLTQFVMGVFQENSLLYVAQQNMSALSNNGWLQFLLASAHLIIAGLIIDQKITNRFEKILTSFIIPLFVVLFGVLLYRSLSLETTPQVLRFVFYPDFSKLNLKSLGHAVGHMCFTLSIGMGVMVTYGSLFKKSQEHLPRLGFRVMMIAVFISLLSVLLVFPVSFAQSGKPLTDPSLLFEALPQLFFKMKWGGFFGFVFFLCVWIAALNASLSLLEALITNFRERFTHKTRSEATWSIIGITLLITLAPAFSGSYFKNIIFFKQTFIENLDSLIINYLLPISCLGVLYLFNKALPVSDQKKSFISDHSESSFVLVNVWQLALKWGVPLVIILGLFLQIVDLFQRS